MIAAKPFLAEGKQEGKNMERTNKLWILDSTLRDGAQGENISFSVQDKLRIVSALDQLGIDYIEAGNPASNPKDLEFFERVRALTLRHARLAAFGSTRRKDERAEDSEGLRALLQANTPAVCIFGKSWDFHVTHILHTTLEENLRMIEQSVAFLKANGREVIFDAEHFFDGYAWNPSYALASLEAAQRGGADCICLCETNGGAFPDQVAQVTTKKVYHMGDKEKSKFSVAVMDYGIKRNILKSLVEKGCCLTVFPAETPAEEVLAIDPDGIFLSNGPGDPADLTVEIDNIKKMIGKKPIFGICMGHQVMALACGAKTKKMLFGHRGINQPVRDYVDNCIMITSQNHGFMVDEDSLKGLHVKVINRSLNDGTIEGIQYLDHPTFTVQFHPEASPGPSGNGYLFDRFITMMGGH